MSRPRPLAALLAAAAAGGPLGGQPFLLGFRAEEPPVLQSPKDPRMLDRGPEPVDQTLGIFSFPWGHKCHLVFLSFSCFSLSCFGLIYHMAMVRSR